MKNDLSKIQHLVGNISWEQMKYVDYAVSNNIGVFMPIAGPCYYSITPSHTHPSYMFIFSFDNYCNLKYKSKLFESKPSHFTVTSPNLPHHEILGDTLARYIAVLINKDYFKSQLKVYSLTLTKDIICDYYPSTERIIASLKEFISEYKEALPGYNELLQSGGMKITHLIIRQMFSLNKSNREQITSLMSINRSLEYINENFSQKITVNDLAHIAYLSPSRFSRVFKQELNLTPAEYLIKVRIDIAKRRIMAGENNLTQIALECGFNSSSYFSQCFFKKCNISPSEFKKTYKTA